MLNKTYLKINRNLTDQFKTEFQSRKTNFKRFECLWTHDDTFVQNEIDKLFNDRNCKNGNNQKDAQRSATLRKHGNELFNKIRLNDAILKYNESLKYSPFNDENLSLAYANRSIAFFKLKEYQLCLNDIELALKYNYPRHLLTKLYERKLDCYLNLNRMECAADFVDDLDCEYQKVLARKLDFSFGNQNKQHENGVILEKLVFEANESIPSACRKITITNSISGGMQKTQNSAGN
jgi:tetratricopeptide (TPR) repeat protein